MSSVSVVDCKFISSPLNYTGGKYRLLGQIMPLFPSDIHIGVDLFCGGANVGINLQAKRIIFNDNVKQLIALYKTLQTHSIESIFETIFSIIEEFRLSNTCKNGYEFYQCDSQKGLSSYNKRGFLALRNRYNIEKRAFICLF